MGPGRPKPVPFQDIELYSGNKPIKLIAKTTIFWQNRRMFNLLFKKERKFSVKPHLNKWLTQAPPSLRNFFEKEDEYLKKNIKSKSNILDIGCGFGRNIKVFAKNAKKVSGIDYDKGVLGTARKELRQYKNVKLFLENAKKLHFRDSEFDYVICMGNTFGNILSIRLQALSEMKRVVRVGGKIIISVFSEKALATQIKGLKVAAFKVIKIKNGKVYTKEGLISERFTKKQLKEIFNSVGLRIKIRQLTPISYICEAVKER